MSEILSCPFCGRPGRADRYEGVDYGRCDNCEILLRIEDWNRRTAVPDDAKVEKPSNPLHPTNVLDTFMRHAGLDSVEAPDDAKQAGDGMRQRLLKLADNWDSPKVSLDGEYVAEEIRKALNG